MFKTSYQNIEYCFYDDYMTVAGASIRYSEMADITHKGGAAPSFAFTYGDRRFTIPYEPADRNMIAPYFVKAYKTPSELNKTAETQMEQPEYAEPMEQSEYTEPVEYEAPMEQPEYTEPADTMEYIEQPEYAEPAEYEAPAEQTEYAETPIEQPEYEAPTEYIEQPEYAEPIEQPEYTEPVEQPEYEAPTEYIEQPEYAEPAEYEAPAEQPEYAEPIEQPEYEAATEYIEQPEYAEPAEYEAPVEQPEYEAPAEPTEYAEPAETAEATEYIEQPEYAEPAEPPAEELEPLGEEKSKAASGGIGGKFKSLPAAVGAMPKKTKLIIGIVAAAVILSIILFAALGGGGQSVEGMDGRVKSHEIEGRSGEKQSVAEIDTDSDVEEYAADYCKKCMDGKTDIHWLFNEKKKETVMFSNQDGVILICSFDMVDGEKDNPDIFGTGVIRGTWIYYMDSGELVKI